MFALVIVTNKMIIGLHLIVILMTGVSGLTNYQQDCVNVCEDQHIFFLNMFVLSLEWYGNGDQKHLDAHEERMLSDPFIPPPRFDLTSEEGVELVEVGEMLVEVEEILVEVLWR